MSIVDHRVTNSNSHEQSSDTLVINHPESTTTTLIALLELGLCEQDMPVYSWVELHKLQFVGHFAWIFLPYVEIPCACC